MTISTALMEGVYHWLITWQLPSLWRTNKRRVLNESCKDARRGNDFGQSQPVSVAARKKLDKCGAAIKYRGSISAALDPIEFTHLSRSNEANLKIKGGKAMWGTVVMWGTVADWFIVLGTLVVAIVAVWQETIRGWFYRPRFQVSIKTEPPDCVSVPFISAHDGQFVADTMYLRLWIENVGNATALKAEVYAKALLRKRADGQWGRVAQFPPMNLKWANGFGIYFPSIAPQMGKHCDLGHITDPSRREVVREDAPKLGLTKQECSLAFDLIETPNHRGHIIGPGEYRLEILVAAQNAAPITRTVTISLKGKWDADEVKMLRDCVGVTVA